MHKNQFVMKKSTANYLLKALFIILLMPTSNHTLAQNTTVVQDQKFEQLLNEKRKYNSGILQSNTYKIQIFSGASEESKNNLISFKKEFKNFDSTIIFNTPNYKVIVGNFKTRIESEKNINLIRKKYPNAILIKPTK